MELIPAFLLVLIGSSLLFWLRTLPFREKPAREAPRTARAELIARRVETGTRCSGRSQGMGYTFVLTFRTEAGETVELFSYDFEYGALREGMTGALTWKGPYYVNFDIATA